MSGAAYHPIINVTRHVSGPKWRSSGLTGRIYRELQGALPHCTIDFADHLIGVRLEAKSTNSTHPPTAILSAHGPTARNIAVRIALDTLPSDQTEQLTVAFYTGSSRGPRDQLSAELAIHSPPASPKIAPLHLSSTTKARLWFAHPDSPPLILQREQRDLHAIFELAYNPTTQQTHGVVCPTKMLPPPLKNLLKLAGELASTQRSVEAILFSRLAFAQDPVDEHGSTRVTPIPGMLLSPSHFQHLEPQLRSMMMVNMRCPSFSERQADGRCALPIDIFDIVVCLSATYQNSQISPGGDLIVDQAALNAGLERRLGALKTVAAYLEKKQRTNTYDYLSITYRIAEMERPSH